MSSDAEVDVGAECPRCGTRSQLVVTADPGCEVFTACGHEVAADGGQDRPYCHRCDRLADVLVLKHPSATARTWAFCDGQDPDPDQYGNQTTWREKITIRRFDEPRPEYAIYGRPGSENRRGRVMHVETPGGDDILCSSEVSDRRRFNLSHTLGDEFVLCRNCLDCSQWADRCDDDVAGKFLFSLCEIASREDALKRDVDRHLEYPTPEPRENHAIAEGYNV